MADEVKSVKDEMNGKSELLPAKWNRFTVADGDWMQSKTLNPLTARDDFLAEQIDKSTTDWQDALSSESATRYSDDQYLSASISSLSGEFYTFSADDYYPTVTALRYDLNSEINRATQAETTLSGRISLEETTRSAEDVKLQNQIDKLKAATDVIAVFGTYDEFVAGSGDLGVTDNDTIKVLRDSHYTPAATDEDYESNDDDGFQVYYEWHDPDAEEQHTDWTGWSAIGSLDPYYSVAEIDEYLDQINNEFDSLSATVANNYLSANNTAVSAGKNIIVTNETGTKIGIKTKDDVSFSSVSATGFSGTNISGVNQHDTIDNLFDSAYSGAEASAWIYTNSAILDIQPGYGLTYDINELGNKVIGIRQDHCDYQKNVYGDGVSLALGTYSTALGNYSYAFGSYCKTNGSNALAIGDNANATTGAIALGTYNSANGKYSLALGYNSTAFNEASVAIGKGLSGEAPITLGTWNDNVAGATFIIGDGTGTQEGHDVVRKNALVIKDGLVSGRDFSAGNVSLSSLTNLSAFGNGITNTATYNLSAVKLSAGEGIGFKEDTNGVLSITAEGRAYTGENYVKVDNTTKKISLSGELVNSAKSGQSAYNWITTKSATLSAGSGINFNSAAQNTLGISVKYTTTNGYVTELDGIPLSAGANYTPGNSISINESNEISLSSDIIVDKINMSDGGTINFDDNDNYKAYLNKNALDFSGTGNFGGINTAHYGIDYIYLSSNGTPGSEVKLYADSVSGKYMNQTYSVNWRNLASAAKLVPGSAISFITNASNETEITMSAIQAQTAYISTNPSPHRITKTDTVTSLEFTPAWYGGVTVSHSWIGVSANNSALGVLTPEPNSLMNNQQKRMLVHYWENNDRGTIGWQDVSSVMNNLNYISGNGTITAMVTATQPGSNANVLYLV